MPNNQVTLHEWMGILRGKECVWFKVSALRQESPQHAQDFPHCSELSVDAWIAPAVHEMFCKPVHSVQTGMNNVGNTKRNALRHTRAIWRVRCGSQAEGTISCSRPGTEGPKWPAEKEGRGWWEDLPGRAAAYYCGSTLGCQLQFSAIAGDACALSVSSLA